MGDSHFDSRQLSRRLAMEDGYNHGSAMKVLAILSGVAHFSREVAPSCSGHEQSLFSITLYAIFLGGERGMEY